jgi:hypothetical protein
MAPTSEVGAFLMGERTYADLKGRLGEALAGLAAMAEERGSTDAAEATRDLAEKLVAERFNVVMVGEFKRGKTTFVNALLGEEVLPAAVVPLTSIVTAVAYDTEIRAEVTFSDGRTERVPADVLAKYVTERENPGNRLGVSRAVLYYPSPYLRDGVFLVDTPGVGSVYTHNTEAAYAFVPEADAAIFLTSADPPVSERERRFLRDVRAHAARMFFVLNKVDYLSPADLEESLAFTRDVLGETLGRDVPVYPVSARQALDAKEEGDPAELDRSGIPAFERDFARFLLEEKGRVILASVGGRARKVAGDERNSVEVEERGLALPADELRRRAEEMERLFSRAMDRRSDIHALLRKDVEGVLRGVEGDLAFLRRHLTPRLLEESLSWLRGQEDPRGAAQELDERVKDRIRTSIDLWRGEEERRVAGLFERAAGRFVEEANALANATVRVASELLEVELHSVDGPLGLPVESRFHYAFFEAPTILESLLPDLRRLLPREMARRRLERDLRERIPVLVEKHCGQLRWDFQQRLERSRLSLERALDEHVDATVGSLRQGIRRSLEEASRSADLAEARRRELAATRWELEAVEREIAEAAGG